MYMYTNTIQWGRKHIEVGGHCVDSYSLSQICITSVNLLISSILHKYFIKKGKINQGVVHRTEF